MGTDSCNSTSSTKLLRDFEYNDDLSYEDNLTIYRSLLNDYDKKKFDVKRQYNYWLTFTICIIYGSVAVIILLSCYFFTWANELFLNTLYYFTITFIIGTILIIIILTYQVYNFDFPKIENIPGYEINYCPDYWNYEHKKYVNNTRLANTLGISVADKEHLGIKCNFNNNPKDILQTEKLLLTKDRNSQNTLWDKENTADAGESFYVTLPQTKDPKLNDLSETEYKNFREYVSVMNGLNYDKPTDTVSVTNHTIQPNYVSDTAGVADIKMDCNNVYPRYLAEKDIKYANDNNNLVDNTFRCAYSKMCKMPWSEAGCHSGDN